MREDHSRDAEKEIVRRDVAEARGGDFETAEDAHRRAMEAERHRKRPRDVNQLAARLVELATDPDATDEPDDGKDPAAVSLGRRGGLKGGKARAANLTPEQRSEIARKAASARWADRSDQ